LEETLQEYFLAWPFCCNLKFPSMPWLGGLRELILRPPPPAAAAAAAAHFIPILID
jgi:hypothetical protein